MKLRERPEDFRVRELLTDDFLTEKGEYRVYRVTKRKMTTQEAARQLAGDLGVDSGDVSFAGLKDRQAITTQYMTVRRGMKLRIREAEWKVEPVGFAHEPLTGAAIDGNAFEIAIRGLRRSEARGVRDNLGAVREHGLINYFDDQRFGNLHHGQGWVTRDLMLGETERALRALLASPGPRDNEHYTRFKNQLRQAWGDWRECRNVAGRFGEHHSVFEHLGRNPEDFAGAFTFIATRIRLIQLYAFQSHVWNRAVAEYLRQSLPLEERVVLESDEGPLVTFPGAPPATLSPTFRLPGVGLEDVENTTHREILTAVLEKEGLTPEQFRVDGVPGFQLKGEERRLVVQPRHLRVRPPESDPDDPRRVILRVRFELPPGGYATLLVKRLTANAFGERAEREESGQEPGARAARPVGGRSPGRGQGGYAGGSRNWRRDDEMERQRYPGGPPPAEGGDDRGFSRAGRGGGRHDDRGGYRRGGGDARGGSRYQRDGAGRGYGGSKPYVGKRDGDRSYRGSQEGGGHGGRRPHRGGGGYQERGGYGGSRDSYDRRSGDGQRRDHGRGGARPWEDRGGERPRRGRDGGYGRGDERRDDRGDNKPGRYQGQRSGGHRGHHDSGPGRGPYGKPDRERGGYGRGRDDDSRDRRDDRGGYGGGGRPWQGGAGRSRDSYDGDRGPRRSGWGKSGPDSRDRGGSYGGGERGRGHQGGAAGDGGPNPWKSGGKARRSGGEGRSYGDDHRGDDRRGEDKDKRGGGGERRPWKPRTGGGSHGGGSWKGKAGGDLPWKPKGDEPGKGNEE